MIRTLLFDLGDVLVKLDFDRLYRAAAARCGQSPEQVRERMREADVAGPYERGEIDSAEFYRRCDAHLGLDQDLASFSTMWSDMFAPDELVSPELIHALLPHYNLAILSNTNALHFEKLHQDYPIVRLFPRAILSYEVGAMKPAPAIYEAALAATASRAEECFFTDDRAENVAGARALGIHAEPFEGQPQLEQALRAAGVRW
ncbi:MAG: HAD family phosphatase [Bryobacterales bacterium]|nr:HAD family phosphatase [Bryobacterales bacterium]